VASLSLDANVRGSVDLRDWLTGDWALLFSHPQDFQDHGLEHDRWVDILREEFRARRVRPLAYVRCSEGIDTTWVSELFCDRRCVRLDASGPASEIVHLGLRGLRADLLDLSQRFVMIIDAIPSRRGLLKYNLVPNTISPLDLLASIDVMRRRVTLRTAA